MKNFLLALIVLGFAPVAFSQTAKSQAEFDAAIAIQSATDPQTRIDAAQKLLKDFKNTDFKEFANLMIFASYQELSDYENMILYGERTLEINPQNPGVLLELANAIPARTREFDLDKEEKLTRAEEFASRALTTIPNLPKPNPDMLDDDWLGMKKDFMSRGNEAMGLIAAKRGNHDEAVDFLIKAIGLAAEPNAMTHYHLADAYMNAGKKADAIASINQSITLGGVPLGSGADAAKVLKEKIEAMP